MTTMTQSLVTQVTHHSLPKKVRDLLDRLWLFRGDQMATVLEHSHLSTRNEFRPRVSLPDGDDLILVSPED